MSQAAIDADGTIRTVAGNRQREETFLPTHVAQVHASFLLALGNGDMACTWFGGEAEGKPDGSIWFTRLPAGSNQWTPEIKVSDDPERSEQNPVLFQAPNGDLWLLWTGQLFGNQATAIVRYRISKDGGVSWGEIGTLFDEVGTFIRQPMLVLANGDWILPVFHCLPVPGEEWKGQNDVSAVKISADQGRTWSEYAVPESKGAVHMNIVQRKDGSLAAFFRSRYADNIMASSSTDNGRSWTKPVATNMPNNNSSIQVRDLGDGSWALVFNNVSAEPQVRAEAKGAPIWGVPRTPLSLALSYDEGRTWPEVRDIELAPEAPPALNLDKPDRRSRELSYPTVTADAQGRINVAFTYGRRAIKFVRVRPDWVRGA